MHSVLHVIRFTKKGESFFFLPTSSQSGDDVRNKYNQLFFFYSEWFFDLWGVVIATSNQLSKAASPGDILIRDSRSDPFRESN